MTNNVGLRMRTRRKELRLTQGDVAERVGVTKASVSQWESSASQVLGKNLVKLAAALETSAQWLMGEEHDPAGRTPLDTARLERVLRLLESLPDHEQIGLSPAKRAKLITYLYGRDLGAMSSSDVSNLLVLLE